METMKPKGMKKDEKPRTRASQKRLDKTQANIAQQVKTYREEKKMTGEKISEDTGLSTSYIYMVEGGNRLPTIHALHDIAESMGCKVEVTLTPVP